jgi:hypothetical protein
MAEECSTHERDEKCILYLVGKSEGKRPLGRTRRRWEDNIKTDIREVSEVWTGFNWPMTATSGEIL